MNGTSLRLFACSFAFQLRGGYFNRKIIELLIRLNYSVKFGFRRKQMMCVCVLVMNIN